MTNFIKKGNTKQNDCCGVEIKEVATESQASCCGTDSAESSVCCGTESQDTAKNSSSCCA